MIQKGQTGIWEDNGGCEGEMPSDRTSTLHRTPAASAGREGAAPSEMEVCPSEGNVMTRQGGMVHQVIRIVDRCSVFSSLIRLGIDKALDVLEPRDVVLPVSDDTASTQPTYLLLLVLAVLQDERG